MPFPACFSLCPSIKYTTVLHQLLVLLAKLLQTRTPTSQLSMQAKAKIMVVRDIERDDIEYISKTLNCLPIAHVDHMKPEKLGHADRVEEVQVGPPLHNIWVTACGSKPAHAQAVLFTIVIQHDQALLYIMMAADTMIGFSPAQIVVPVLYVPSTDYCEGISPGKYHCCLCCSFALGQSRQPCEYSMTSGGLWTSSSFARNHNADTMSC